MLETTTAYEAGLSDRPQQVAAALLRNATIRDASFDAGVSESTIYRYKADPIFQAAYKDLKRLALEQAVSRLHSGMGVAVDTLIDVMQDKSSPTARVGVASKLIQYCLKTYYDLSELDELVAELREGLNALDQ